MPGEDLDVFTNLFSLVEKNLLRLIEGDGGCRFRMLETIHEYAQERLKESGELDGLKERFAAYFIRFAEKYHLSDAHIQMVRELGPNPKKFGGLANTKQEPWKLPLPEFIEELYVKHSKKIRPDRVRSIEQVVHESNRKKAERRVRKQAARLSGQSSEDALPPQSLRSARCTGCASI